MANQENIEPYKMRPNCERTARMTRNGGIASGKARRAKRNMRELAEMMLNSKATGANLKSAKALGSELDDEDMTNAAAIIAGQMKSAMKGNTNAAKWLSELVGEIAENEADDDALSKSLEELAKKL